MLVANRHTSQSEVAAPRRRGSATLSRAAATLPRAASVPRGDRLAGQLARAVAQRPAAGSPLLMRAIVAIDGSTDSPIAKKITRNCLHNLRTTRDRGKAAGPKAIDRITAPKLGKHESLYILGHGNTGQIGDSSPEALGDQILHWYGTTAYRGKVKLVACSSGVDPGDGMTASYTERLNDHLAANATPTFRPKSVDGVLGVAWVHEGSGKIVAIDDAKYDEHEHNTPGAVEGAFATKSMRRRGEALEQLFGVPDAPQSSTHTGGTAKVRFFTGLPKGQPPPPPTPSALRRFLSKLIPCIP